MKLLSIASECYPLVKTGGLADVVGALPVALARHGVATRTLLPGYPVVLKAVAKGRTVGRYRDLFGGAARLLAVEHDGLDLLLLDAPHLFDRAGGPYAGPDGTDWPDNWRRFAALSRAGAEIGAGALKSWRPDVVHAHDWQAALALAYLRFSTPGRVARVMTIHNLAFQGRFPAEIFAELGLPPEAAGIDGIEYYGGVGFLKAGLQAADAITTVSPSYAREIATPAFGIGLEGLIRTRAALVHGILNGIDDQVWDPARDPALVAPYGPRQLAHRARNKAAVEVRFGLDADTGPLVCVVSRLTAQKGMDVLAMVLDEIVAMGARLAVLGSGEAGIEAAFHAAAARHPGRIGVVTAFDEPLSHLLQGGADAILIPSRFEPCGLTQLYGLRYGCVPIVARTGGLADTVIDANDAALEAGVATGFQFAPVEPEALLETVRRAITLFAQPERWTSLQRNGMKAEVGWGRSAAAYAALYRTLIGEPA